MSTFAAVYASKPAWQLQLDVSETSLDAVNNQSYVSWALYIMRGNGDTPYNQSGSAFDVSAPGGVSGTFGAYRFGSSGSGTNYSGTAVGDRVLIASGGAWVGHSSDGSGYIVVSADHYAGATLGTASIGASGMSLTTLTQAPGVPASVAGAYTSDTQATVSWRDTSASNGQPTSDQIQTSTNGAAFAQVASISPATSVVITVAGNQKVVAQIKTSNGAGVSAWSASTGAVYTTPAAPTAVAAAKSGTSIVVSWTPQVPFVEHQHVVEHGTVAGGTTTWDGSPLASVAAGTTSFTHVSPNASYVHVYRVSAKNTDTGALHSATVTSNTVQLLTAPNAPTLPVLPAYADKAVALVVTWSHNSVDTSPQSAYEFGYSTDGGTTWLTTGKVVSTVSSKTFAANAYAAGVALSGRVRDWGQATTGGADGTGASPWSAVQTLTFRTAPVVTVVTPANGSTWTMSALTVALGFTQAEGATFVSSTIVLQAGATVLETLTSTTLAGTALATKAVNGTSYTLNVTALDSDGLTSAVATATFTVAFTLPVPATLAPVYLPTSGIGQLEVSVPTPNAGQSAAVSFTITRTIAGAVETVVAGYPVSAPLAVTILDITPVTFGTNLYTITTFSADGAASVTLASLVTTEGVWAFLSTPANEILPTTTIISFFGDLTFAAVAARATTLVKAADRKLPIALFGANTTREVSGSATLISGTGSSTQEVEAFILGAERVCYRDPSGRRMFGVIAGTVDYTNARLGKFTFKVSEAS